jgi:hypothetical protein
MNRRASESRGNTVPYETYFAFPTVSEVEKTLGALARNIKTEVGLQLIEGVLVNLKNNYPRLQLSDYDIIDIIQQGDALYDAEQLLESTEEKEAFDIDKQRNDLLSAILEKITDEMIDEVGRFGSEEVVGNKEVNNGDEETNGDEEADGNDEEDKSDEAEKATNEEDNDGDEEQSNATTVIEEASEDSDTNDDEAEKQVQRRGKMRAQLRVIAAEGQQQQARRVNAARGVNWKEVLEVGDICLIRTDATTRAATDKAAICVKICAVRSYTSPTTKTKTHSYKVCTSDGYVKNFLHRTCLEYQEKLTAEILSIDENKEGFLNELSIQDASNKSNVLGGSTTCRCTTDCSISKTCKCKKNGNFCNTKCHNGRGKNIHCLLCYTEEPKI